MIILASKSPRRRELFALLGVEYQVLVQDTEERVNPTLSPREAVQQISRGKAEAVLSLTEPGDLIVAADTVVVLGDRVLGKPHDPAEARAMLRALSGKTHRVMTGVTVRQGDRELLHTEITEVTFRDLTEVEIATYVATGDPMDKAGAYGVQNEGALFVSGLKGDFFNVMGLPVCALAQMLRRFGVVILGEGGTGQ